MTCLACDEDFGPDDQCANCGAYEGETDVDRIIRNLEEDVERLQGELDALHTAIRGADEERVEHEGDPVTTVLARRLNGLIYDLAAKVN